MAVITREDGERFVVPTYRDILSAKKIGLLKREIQLLSTNYGEYITLQKKIPYAIRSGFFNRTWVFTGGISMEFF